MRFEIRTRAQFHAANEYSVIETTNDREHASTRAESVFMNTPDIRRVWVTDQRGKVITDRDGREYVWERSEIAA